MASRKRSRSVTETKPVALKLDAQERAFLRLVYGEHVDQGVAWQMVNPGKKWANKNTLGSVASQVMSRIKEKTDLDGFLRARGIDDDAIARVIGDAMKASRVVVGGNGKVYKSKDHNVRLKAADRVIGLRYGKEGGGQVTEQHLHIHLPGKIESEREWERQSRPRLLKLDKIGTQPKGKR